MNEIDLMDMEELAVGLGVKAPTLRKLYKAWGIPSRKIGGRLVRFSRREVAEWVEARRQAPLHAGSVSEIGPDGRRK